MRLSEYASTRKTRGSYKMPRSVQQSIPIDRIYADGVWQSGNVFSRMWQISDINYAMQSDAAKQNILTQLGTLYAGIPADCWMQVCIVSQRIHGHPALCSKSRVCIEPVRTDYEKGKCPARR